MPQTSPERAARWPGGDEEAIAFLLAGGWRLGRDWCWRRDDWREPTEREVDAVRYLIEEWDFDGIVYPEEPVHAG
jgi:hypothetical protein